MPEMDGWKMLEHMRSRQETKNLGVITLRARAMKENQEAIEAAGFDGYVGKPYLIKELLTEMKRCVAAVGRREIS